MDRACTQVLLVIKGTAVPKGRHKFGKGYTYTPEPTRRHEALVRSEYLVCGGHMLHGPIEAEFEFIFEPPKSWSKKKKLQAIGKPKMTRPDLDNLIKCCEDALNGVAYTDDGRIWKTTAQKIYGEEAMTIIKLREVESD